MAIKPLLKKQPQSTKRAMQWLVFFIGACVLHLLVFAVIVLFRQQMKIETWSEVAMDTYFAEDKMAMASHDLHAESKLKDHTKTSTHSHPLSHLWERGRGEGVSHEKPSPPPLSRKRERGLDLLQERGLELQERELDNVAPSSTSTSASHAAVDYRHGVTENKRVILKILHNAIAEKQVYPETAIQLNQSGTVTISFVLSPSGELNNISLFQSSGFTTIDQAALKAVQATSPIKAAGRYLQQPERFEIAVVFE